MSLHLAKENEGYALSVEVPGPDARKVAAVSLLGELVEAVHNELRGTFSEIHENIHKGGTNLYVLPVLHQHDVHLVDDEKLDGGEEVGIPARGISQRSSSRSRTRETYFSFSILVRNPRGLATITSQL